MSRSTALRRISASARVRGSTGCAGGAELACSCLTCALEKLPTTQRCEEGDYWSRASSLLPDAPPMGMADAMVRFGEQLKEALHRRHWNQADLARQTGSSKGNVSRWCRGESLPAPEVLAKLVDAVADEDAPHLVEAWIADFLPAEVHKLVTVMPRRASTRVAEQTDAWPQGMSRETRQKFLDFSRLAMNNAEVMKIVEVLHTAAMRMERREPRKGR